MATRKVCDFCKKDRFIAREIKVRGRLWSYVPGMNHNFGQRLELCRDCYYDMVKYIADKRGVK